MISLTLSPAEALAVHRALDREARCWGSGSFEQHCCRGVSERLARAIVEDARAEPAVEKAADQTCPGSGI